MGHTTSELDNHSLDAGHSDASLPFTEDEVQARLLHFTEHYLRIYVWGFALLFPLFGVLDALYLGRDALLYVVLRILISGSVLALWTITRKSEQFRFYSVHLLLVLGLLHTIALYWALQGTAGMFYLHLIAAIYVLTPILILWKAGHMLVQWILATGLLFTAAWLIPDVDPTNLMVRGGAVIIVAVTVATMIPRFALPYRRDVAETRIMLEKGHFKAVAARVAKFNATAGMMHTYHPEKHTREQHESPLQSNSDALNRPRFATLDGPAPLADRLPLQRADTGEIMRTVLNDLQSETRSNNVQIDFFRPKEELLALVNLPAAQLALTTICTELIRYGKGMRMQVIMESNEHFVLIHFTVSKTGIANEELESIFKMLDILARKLRPYTEKTSQKMFKAAFVLGGMNATLLHTDTGTDVRYARIALHVNDSLHA